MGMCQTCYLSDYHKRRTKVKRKAQQIKAKAIKEEAKKSCQSIYSDSINKINQDIGEESTYLGASAQKSAQTEEKCLM
jgi:hypothetical protein